MEQLSADIYLLGSIDFERTLRLQRRLAFHASDRHDPRMAVILCEHSDLITIGRAGSRVHIRSTDEQLRRRGIQTRWVSRGGGAIPHATGQLAIYPIVSLHAAKWSVGEYLRRFQAGLRAAIEHFNVHTSVRPDGFGIWGQTGLLAAMGVAVQNGVSLQGAFFNVNPSMNLFHFVQSDARCQDGERGAMSCLFAERRVSVKMPKVRTVVVQSLVESFGIERHQVHSTHPWLGSPGRRGGVGETQSEFV